MLAVPKEGATSPEEPNRQPEGRMRLRLPSAFATALVLQLWSPISAHALTIVSQSVNYLPATESFEFAITLSGPPDFVTVDGLGRQKDGFQYWVRWDVLGTPFTSPNVIVRSPDPGIGQLGICNADGINPHPVCSTWGSLRGSVAYQLNGATVTFSVPRTTLGDPDGVVSYFLGVLNFGGFTDTRSGISTGPTPAAPATWGRIKLIYR